MHVRYVWGEADHDEDCNGPNDTNTVDRQRKGWDPWGILWVAWRHEWLTETSCVSGQPWWSGTQLVGPGHLHQGRPHPLGNPVHDTRTHSQEHPRTFL